MNPTRSRTRGRAGLGALALAGSLVAQIPEPAKLTPPTAPVLLPKPKGTFFLASPPPAYPAFTDRRHVISEAQAISDALDRYIRAWLDGKAPDLIPEGFIPPGVNRKDFGRFRLVRADQIKPEDCWAIRPARAISRNGHVGFFPDPNVTYLVIPAMLLPFGYRVVLEGEFPRARFFDIQVTPAFRPEDYHYDGGVGVGEVPLVDADIEPMPGQVNPFRPGGDRTATRRGYRVELAMTQGDPVALNPSFRPPHFRAPGNLRFGSGLMYQGAWGIPHQGAHRSGHGRGIWDTGQLWLRYYAPDRGTEPFAGVPLPRIAYETPEGQRFFLQPELTSFNARANRVVKVKEEGPVEPSTALHSGPEDGWFKQTGIFRAVVTGLALNSKLATPEYVRLLDKGVAGRGSDLPAPGNYEQSATSATYVDYLTRGMELGKDRVVVLTGKLPTFPATRLGEPRFPGAEMRYWSLVGYQVPGAWGLFKALVDPEATIGVATHAVMDDELLLDGERRYVLALSRPEGRPANATAANGVTWVDWGPSARVSWTLRWLTVGPEWTSSSAPTPQKLGRRGDAADPGYDPTAIGRNSHDGALGEYLPRVHYLTRKEFEALGSRVSATRVPLWRK